VVVAVPPLSIGRTPVTCVARFKVPEMVERVEVAAAYTFPFASIANPLGPESAVSQVAPLLVNAVVEAFWKYDATAVVEVATKLAASTRPVKVTET